MEKIGIALVLNLFLNIPVGPSLSRCSRKPRRHSAVRSRISPAQFEFGQRTMGAAPIDPKHQDRKNDGQKVQQHNQT
jgi:hypothetical protein